MITITQLKPMDMQVANATRRSYWHLAGVVRRAPGGWGSGSP
jgi:hypothetical protein